MASVFVRRMPRMHCAVRNLGTAWSCGSSYQSNRIVCPTLAVYSKQHPSFSTTTTPWSAHNHPATSKPPSSAASAASKETTPSSDDHGVDKRLLSANDDLMVGHYGIETIDPKDYPELFPDHDGLDSVHASDETEGGDGGVAAGASVLLSDKERSDDEMSWFVDASYQDKATATEGDSAQQGDSFVPLWQRNAERNRAATAAGSAAAAAAVPSDGPMTVTGLVQLLESERAKNVHVIDMRDKCDWTNWMIICEGMSERHLGNLADHVYSNIKKHSPKSHPPVMEGRDTTDWIVIDADTVVLHFMTHEARKERDLEGLWASVTNPLKIKDAADISWDDVKGKMKKAWKEDHGRSKGEDGKRGRRGERDIPLSEVVRW